MNLQRPPRLPASFSVAHYLDWASAELASLNADDSRRDAQRLLAHCLSVNRTFLVTHGEHVLEESTRATFSDWVKRRAQGEPLAYVLGTQEFWSLTLLVSSAVLIPRPETELLVEQALQVLDPARSYWAADLGTGCGAIACALAQERPQLRLVAVDHSAAALDVAQHNVRALNLSKQIQLQRANWCAGLAPKAFDLLVANPPYVAIADPDLDPAVAHFEPAEALFAGPEGLAALQTLIATAPVYLKTQGWLMLEHGYQQAARVAELLNAHQFANIECVKDNHGHERVTRAMWKGKS